MRVAALYDIHGNLPALEAVLREIQQEGIDQVVVGGDVVAGPMPRETLELLQSLTIPVQFIQGNADAEVVAQLGGQSVGTVPDSVLEIIQWTAQQLKDKHAGWLSQWPLTARLTIPNLGSVLFCHATPRSNTEVFTKLTPETKILAAFATPEADLVVCGHTHMPFDRQVGTRRVVNAGSVGMPYGKVGASWLLLGPEVQFRHTTYDFADAAARICLTTYPQAESFAAQNVLRVPTEAQALAVFTQMEQAQQVSWGQQHWEFIPVPAL